MYKLLLCLRYLRTRYLAFVCVVSVMLGVGTLIVVNSVMSGFGNKLRTSLNGLSGDLTIHTEASAGFTQSPAEIERRIKASPVGKYVQAVSPNVDFYAMLQYQLRTSDGQVVPITKMVRLVGVDPERHSKVGKFAEYLTNSSADPGRCFTLSPEGQRRFDQNRMLEAWDAQRDELMRQPAVPDHPFPPAPRGEPGKNAFGMPVVVPKADETKPPLAAPDLPQAAPVRPSGIVLGYAIAHHKEQGKTPEEAKEYTLLHPGDDVFVATIGSSGTRPVSANFVVTDYFKSEMSEYDGNVVYVPLADLQRMRAMDDQVNSFQIRLTEDVRENPAFVHEHIVPAIQELMHGKEENVRSWWQQQTALFAAIDIERGLLNILLFMIVGVAGFGVLAIFSMIVAEKYRDIGILKSLGASGGGVMSIFVGYGLLLGLIGCGLGTAMGLWITFNLNDIETALSRLTGQQIFDRKIYYFDKIPTHVDALSVALVNLGAVAIAVASSILPAVRAARLQPVRALRFE